ncbi:plastidic ATP/ADP-transporter-like [Curcuma longa]|uniref:plastidic ATP/ADP-transporter-like n=1 Tax=Curcuma longa TaxID=136217 RepID=UPI003D9EAF8E
MERVISAQGLLSLPPTPQARTFHLRLRLPFAAVRFPSPVLSNHAFHGFISKEVTPSFPRLRAAGDSQRFLLSPGLYGKQKKAPVFSASAAVPAGGTGVVEGEAEKPKLLGVNITTLKKIIPLGIMFFCILFNYTILRDTKDVLVVTAKGSSAEIIPFLKTWVNLPMAIGFMLLYTKLSNVLSKEALFYTVIFPFIAFFGAFAFLLYPLRDTIHPTALADKLLAALGPSFLGPVAILRIWSFCLFYVMAELWGSVVISVLFWGFANQVIYACCLELFNCFLNAYSICYTM